ncbi:MAG: DUF4058 family protein [Microcoleus sp. SIO2G3]|nr:DUF4058 family protein [Microcoleus sp. SIO2G3]
MPCLCPGINLYLEHPALWSGIYHRLITAIPFSESTLPNR